MLDSTKNAGRAGQNLLRGRSSPRLIAGFSAARLVLGDANKNPLRSAARMPRRIRAPDRVEFGITVRVVPVGWLVWADVQD